MSARGRRLDTVAAAMARVMLLIVLGTTPASAAKAPNTPARKPNTQQQLDAQRRTIEELQARVFEQQRLVDSTRAMSDSQSVVMRARLDSLERLQVRMDTMQRKLDEVASQQGLAPVDTALEARLAQVEAATQRAPELPPDIVSAGEFPGSIRIPGSDAAIKFGGRIRTAVVLTLDPLGTDDRFLTNSIPVGGVSVGEAKRTNISARASRLNIEFRTPGGVQEVRAFFEGDFAGDNNAFRLRHAYAQYRGVIAGQTWSTFSDPAVNLQDLDFEGVSSENLIRQPQVRYWWSPRPGTRLAGAIETPSVSITGAAGVNLMPDVVLRMYDDILVDGHYQVAGVLRQIRGQVPRGEVDYVWAGGGTFSGVLPFRLKGLTDRIMFQVNAGTGIARYINDLSSLGGQDAVVDTATGQIKALPAVGWYVALEHRWKEWASLEQMNVRSTVLWSYVDVYNRDFQPPDAYHKTSRVAVNAIFSPSKRLDLGVEFINGSRTNKNGARGTANQVQLVALIHF